MSFIQRYGRCVLARINQELNTENLSQESSSEEPKNLEISTESTENE